MTAAGKVPPAKVLVLGVGVAGLAAIQTAKVSKMDYDTLMLSLLMTLTNPLIRIWGLSFERLMLGR